MIQKSEGAGLGVSVAGHIVLLAILSLNLMSVREMPKLSEPMDVMLVDRAGLTSAAPQIAKEAPQAAEAPDVADTIEDAQPPEPAPTLPNKPDPAPPKPAPSPKAIKAVPPAPVKAPPARPAPPAPVKAKPKATSLGTDFLKGIPVAKSTGKAEAPRAAAISPLAMNGLAALLLQQVRPCYNPPAGGTETGSIATVLNLKMKRDGSVASVEIGEQTGISDQNRPYARQMADAARRAVLRCSPFKLPAELYEGGWDDFAFRFRPL